MTVGKKIIKNTQHVVEIISRLESAQNKTSGLYDLRGIVNQLVLTTYNFRELENSTVYDTRWIKSMPQKTTQSVTTAAENKST